MKNTKQRYELYFINTQNSSYFFNLLTITQIVLTAIKALLYYKANLYLFLSLNNRVTTKVKASKVTNETVR